MIHPGGREATRVLSGCFPKEKSVSESKVSVDQVREALGKVMDPGYSATWCRWE